MFLGITKARAARFTVLTSSSVLSWVVSCGSGELSRDDAPSSAADNTTTPSAGVSGANNMSLWPAASVNAPAQPAETPINPAEPGQVSVPAPSEHVEDPSVMPAPVSGDQVGYASRFWDCCKPHCAWAQNTGSPMNTCDQQDQSIDNRAAQSSCDGGKAHTCHNLAPWTVNSKVAYGYAATPAEGDICGRCYQLDFTGEGQHGVNPGSTAMQGKTMIVQAINIGHDVAGGQFDILVPGGGVGAFNACSTQWGVSNDELGEQYGGFLGKCNEQLGYNQNQEAYRSCVQNQCEQVFGARGLTELEQGCNWFTTWFETADNPKVRYQEVECPAELSDRSGLRR